jgi:hypothetical protein
MERQDAADVQELREGEGMMKLLLILALLLVSPAWAAEKKAEPKGQTAKIVVDVPGKTEQQAVVVETTKKVKANLIGGAQAKRMKR